MHARGAAIQNYLTEKSGYSLTVITNVTAAAGSLRSSLACSSTGTSSQFEELGVRGSYGFVGSMTIEIVCSIALLVILNVCSISVMARMWISRHFILVRRNYTITLHISGELCTSLKHVLSTPSIDEAAHRAAFVLFSLLAGLSYMQVRARLVNCI
jgi:hypothetical protein